MRLAWRPDTGKKSAPTLGMLGLLLTLCSCSLPDVSIDKQPQRAAVAGAAFSSGGKRDDHGAVSSFSETNSYLATVCVQYSETAPPVNFDVRRNRNDLISVNMQQSETTSTSLHLGYSHGEGGMAGLRFSWHF